MGCLTCLAVAAWRTTGLPDEGIETISECRCCYCSLIDIVATTTMIFVIVVESISEMWAILDYLATDFRISSTQQNTIIAVSPLPSSLTS